MSPSAGPWQRRDAGHHILGMTRLRWRCGLLPAVLAVVGMMAADSARAQTDFVSMTGAYLASRAAIYQGDMILRADFLSQALDTSPDDKTLLSEAHNALLSVGRVREAVQLAKRLLARGLKTEFSSATLLVDALKADDTGRAREAFGQLPEEGSSGHLVSLVRAWLTAKEGDYSLALESIGPPSKSDGFDPVRAYHIALIKDLAGDPISAGRAFNLAWEPQGNVTWETARAYGGFLERHGRGVEAHDVYSRYIDVNPTNLWFEAQLERSLKGGKPPAPIQADLAIIDAFAAVARKLVAERRGSGALALLNQAAYLAPDDDRTHFMIGEVLALHGRFPESAEAYGLVSGQSSMFWSARLGRARSLHGMGHTDEAVSLLRTMSGEKPLSAGPFVAIGDIMRSRRRWNEAVEAYDEALGRLGDTAGIRPDVLFDLGTVLEMSGDWERAERALIDSLETRPDDPYALNYLGYSWADRGEHLVEALDLIERAANQTPNDGMIIDSLGWVLYRLQRFEEAVAQLERAAELEPSEPVIIDHLGDAYWMAGRRYEARFQWRRVLTLEPEDDTLIEAVRHKLQSGLDESDL